MWVTRGSGVAAVVAAALFAGASAHAQPPVVAVKASAGHFSPNGDRRDDRVAANVTISEPATLDVQVMDHKGVPVASLASATPVGAGMTRLTWDGKAATGTRVQDGRYTIHTTATGPTLEAAVTDVNVVVDTHAPRVRWRFSRPLHLTRRMRALPISIVDVSDTRPRAKLLVETEAGAPARSFRVRSEGRKVDVRALRKLDPGLYHVRVEVIDIAGNVGASPEGDVLVDHPVSSRVVSRFLGVGRRVALTFDDCNVGSAWNGILTTLQQFHAKATFFCTGAAVLQNTAAALRTVRLGQTIGDHSFGHPDLSTYSFGPARTQFLRDQAIWWRLAKRTPLPFFRPPYGAYDHTTLAAAGSAGFAWTVLWDVDTRDWTLPGSNTIAARVLGEMRSGSIVLMHTLPQTAAALPTILRGLRRRHYQPLPLDQLFLLHGAQPIPGGWAPH